jgi:DNA-binding Xre family transcriptional regulator
MLLLCSHYCQGGTRCKMKSMKTRNRLKEVATQKGMSMTKLSHRSEVAYNTIRKLWNNPDAEVTLTTLRRLADALGVSVHDLIEEVDD